MNANTASAQSLCGWTGAIARVDLTTGRVSTMDTRHYLPDYVGGLGIAARIAWDELKPGTDAFSPDNILFIMNGPLTGTLASGAGRVVVAGIAPQQKPPVFSRSGMGGHWGAELKFAGYDGLVITGASDEPVYLWIHDGKIEVRPAQDLWGRGIYATTTALRNRHGAKARVVAIGPAGENLCRIACLQTETRNAAGQGGYGAVMGAKNLKAVAVRGTGGVRVARPRELTDICLDASREGQRAPRPTPQGTTAAPRPVRDPLPPGATVQQRKCGFCMTPCGSRHYANMPGEKTSAFYQADWFCYSYGATSIQTQIEALAMTGDMGLNGWEISFGIIPWLQMCKQEGLVDDIDGIDLPVPDHEVLYRQDAAPVSAEFLVPLIQKITYREGEFGEALSHGVCYAAEHLFEGRGLHLIDRIYPRRAGQTSHWNAHWGTGGNIYFPFWLVPILQWCVDTRDPASDSTHGYSTHMLSYLPVHGPTQGPVPMEAARAVCHKVYGLADVCNPDLAYERPETKVIPAIFHHDRGMLVESLVLCDKEHSRVFSLESDDYAADTALMAKLYSATTGHDVTEHELDRAGARIFNLLRAIDIRNHGRNRKIDQSTLVSMAHPAFTDDISLDIDAFIPMLDHYYATRGWDVTTGYPTRTKLEELGLSDVADALELSGVDQTIS